MWAISCSAYRTDTDQGLCHDFQISFVSPGNISRFTTKKLPTFSTILAESHDGRRTATDNQAGIEILIIKKLKKIARSWLMTYSVNLQLKIAVIIRGLLVRKILLKLNPPWRVHANWNEFAKLLELTFGWRFEDAIQACSIQSVAEARANDFFIFVRQIPFACPTHRCCFCFEQWRVRTPEPSVMSWHTLATASR